MPLAFKGVSDYIEEKLAAKGRVGDRSALQGIEAFKRGAAAIDGGSIRLVSSPMGLDEGVALRDCHAVLRRQ